MHMNNYENFQNDMVDGRLMENLIFARRVVFLHAVSLFLIML